MENREPMDKNAENIKEKLAADLAKEMSKTPTEKQAEQIAREEKFKTEQAEAAQKQQAELASGRVLEIEKAQTESAREAVEQAPEQTTTKEDLESSISNHYAKELEKSFEDTPFRLESAGLTDRGYEITITIEGKPVYDVKELPPASQEIYSKLLTALVNESAVRFGKNREEVQAATQKAQEAQGKKGIWSKIKGIFGIGK